MTELVVSVFAIAVACCFLGFAGYVWRRWEEPGVRWFSGVLGLFGISLVGEVCILLAAPNPTDTQSGVFVTNSALLFYVVSSVFFLLFALEYSGRRDRISRSRGAVLVSAMTVFATLDAVLDRNITFGSRLLELAVRTVVSFATLAGFASIGVCIFFVIQTTRKYGHSRTLEGVFFTLGTVFPLLATALVFFWDFSALTLAGLAVGYGGSLGCFVLAVSYFGLFDSTVAVGEIGRAQFVEETDSLFFATDHRGIVIDTNEMAVETLDLTDDHHGKPLQDLLGHSVEDLRDVRTLPFVTASGRRQYQPAITEMTDQQGRSLGSLVTLTDITDRRIREQRLEVFNRVLRHNLRNILTQAKGFTQMAAENADNEDVVAQLDTSLDAIGELLEIGEQAREIEELMDRERTGGSVIDLEGLVREVAADARTDHPLATVSVSSPDVRIESSRGLLYYVIHNLVENGIVHNDSDEPTVEVTVTVEEDASYPITIAVADDGPGIPDEELEIIEVQQESKLEHSSGLGLWITNWGITQIGGQLTFETDTNGTVAIVRLPQSPVAAHNHAD